MNFLLPEEQPFTSWRDVRDAVSRLGSKQLLRGLVRRASRSVHRTGQFQSDATHTNLNHPLVARTALDLMARGDDGAGQHRTEMEAARDLEPMLRKLNGLAWGPAHQDLARHPRGGRAGEFRRFVEFGCWYPHLLLANRLNFGKFEIARSFLLMRVYFAECRDSFAKGYTSRTGRALPAPLVSAFQSMEYETMLCYVMVVTDGWVEDPTVAFANSKISECLENFLSCYGVDGDSPALGSGSLERWPQEAMESPFHMTPFVRLRGGELISPDPGLLFTGLTDRFLARSNSAYAADDPEIRDAGPRVFGSVFEMHVRQLVEELAEYDAGSPVAVGEFKYDDDTDSADAHLIDKGTVVFFEAKVAGLPRPFERHRGLEGLFGWLDKLAGRNETRGPLAQGVRHISMWARGDRRATEHLGNPRAVGRVRYLIIARDQIPFAVHWKRFRTELWQGRLGAAERALDDDTSFLSISDLEIACAVLQSLSAEARRGSFVGLLDAWVEKCSATALVDRGPNPGGVGGFGDFLAGRFPSAGQCMPVRMRAALDEMNDEISALGFGDQSRPEQ